MSNSEKININRCLPPEIAIKSAGTHLYRIGLSEFTFGPYLRSKFYNPHLVFAILFIYYFRLIIFLFVEFDDPNTFLMFGDFAYFLKVRNHMNLFGSIAGLFSLITHIIHHYNYVNHITPSYMKL